MIQVIKSQSQIFAFVFNYEEDHVVFTKFVHSKNIGYMEQKSNYRRMIIVSNFDSTNFIFSTHFSKLPIQ